MKKVSLILAVVLTCLLICPVFAFARASEYLSDYTVTALEGDSRGEVNFNFTVHATEIVSKIGALKIEIYQSNGEYVTTIWGTTLNGLLSPKRALIYAYTYPYEGTPGLSYYAEITLCAGAATDYDTRELKTSIVTAPY